MTLSAAQTADGALQFGCRDLVSFDGERWTITRLNNGYAIYDLDVAPDGKLWAAAIGEIGWFERRPSGWEYHSLVSHLSAEDQKFGVAWHVYSTKYGAVFVCDEKVLQWNGAALKAWPMTGTRHVRGLNADDRVFVQHRPTGVYEITPEGPVMFLPASVVGDAGILLLERHGAEWNVVRADGLFRCDGRTMLPINGTGSEYIRNHKLTAAIRLPDGRLALGTTDAGVVFIDAAGTLESAANELGSEERYIHSLFLDRQGALWAMSNSAVYRIATTSPSQIFDSRAQLFSQQINRIEKDGDSIVLLTSDALYRLTSNQRGIQRISLPDQNRFWDAQPSPAGLLVGGFGRLYRMTDAGPKIVHQGVQDVAAISSWQHGRQLFTHGRDLLSISDDDTTRVVLKDLPDFPTSLVVDRQDRIFFGTVGGRLWRISSEANRVDLQAVGAAEGLGSAPGASAVAIAANGTVVACNGAGVWFQTPGSDRFERVRDFPDGFSVAVHPSADSAGNLWLVAKSADAHQHRVGRISFAQGSPRWEPHSVEGLSQIGVPRSVYLEESPGRPAALWIGGMTGVLRNEVGRDVSAPQPEVPLLRAYATSATGEHAVVMSRLPYSTRSIDFEFAAPDFARRPLLRLETKIDGIDHDWVPAGPDSRRQLTAVRDGDYTFRVRAVAETGVASEPAVFEFSVAPPWWRTVPALLGVVFALFPAGYGVHRLRLRALARRTRELEAKVRQRTEQLEQANAAKTQFVANMSHDIRNPLNGIVGLALALEDTRLDTKQREMVATLRECTTYLSSLVDDVLDFASIEAGRVELRPGPFMPRELLQSIVTTTKTDTLESGARLVVDADPALPQILSGDAGRIQQILVNYVSNALKYAGGTIHLTATIPLGSTDEVEFSVSDEGPGISAAEQATLFTKFTRLTGARDHDIPGAGLGLAACRLLADIMGGSVGVVSEPGHGARFFLRLPLTRAEIPIPPADGELPNTTVLLVEDTDYNALAATAVLRRLGLTCERARTGEEALQLFTAKRYNLVLLDRNLPDMDGTEIAKKMRAMESDGARSIMLAVTAYCTAEDRKLCLDAGMDAFVGKPLTPEKLRKVLLAAGRRMLAAATFDATPDVATPAASTAAEVDLSLLNYMAEGTDGGLEAQVGRFLASLAEHEAEMTAAARRQDISALGTAAHRILGQARMVGAASLTTAATELQEAARAGEVASCVELPPRVAAEIHALTAALRRRRSGALTS